MTRCLFQFHNSDLSFDKKTMVGFIRPNKTGDSELDRVGNPSLGNDNNAVQSVNLDDHIRSDDERSVDERSIAADSWSVKSEYGSTLDGDDQRHVDVTEIMATVTHEAINEG